MKKVIIVLVIALVLISAIMVYVSLTKETVVKFENVEIEVEVADTPKEKEIGLMNREFLDEDKGMLFVFSEEDRRTFWMKNTLIPLDIIFLDRNKRIVDIIENTTPCYEDPCELYNSVGMYVIEVNAGFSKKNNLSIGDIVKFINF